MIYYPNQLTGFYMTGTLVINVFIIIKNLFIRIFEKFSARAILKNIYTY